MHLPSSVPLHHPGLAAPNTGTTPAAWDNGPSWFFRAPQAAEQRCGLSLFPAFLSARLPCGLASHAQASLPNPWPAGPSLPACWFTGQPPGTRPAPALAAGPQGCVCVTPTELASRALAGTNKEETGDPQSTSSGPRAEGASSVFQASKERCPEGCSGQTRGHQTSSSITPRGLRVRQLWVPFSQPSPALPRSRAEPITLPQEPPDTAQAEHDTTGRRPRGLQGLEIGKSRKHLLEI